MLVLSTGIIKARITLIIAGLEANEALPLVVGVVNEVPIYGMEKNYSGILKSTM